LYLRYSSEPPRSEALRALLAHPHVVCTPHLGASTEEAQINVARDIAAQVCDVFDQKEVTISHISKNFESNRLFFGGSTLAL
jgi:phosphoglycerate dehydrogenase-like enzyme